MKGILKYFIFLSLLPVFGFGQIYLSGLSSNPVIKNYLKNSNRLPSVKSTDASVEPLLLPFSDDFSYEGPYPDPSKWIDSAVYINAHYPVYPVDYGVATFDVLNDTGGIYPDANVFPFIADHLTSYPIRLDTIFDLVLDTSWKVSAADSIYLSFYYQPQGRGDAPLGYDSLALEFGTTDTVFKEIEKKWLYISEATNSSGKPFTEIDTIKPNDTIFYAGCDYTYVITPDTLYYSDSVYVPCDSIFIPETNWKNIWNAPGKTLDQFISENNVYFKIVLIPITDTIWFRRDFQFRFYNYGSLASINSWKTNTDHWHIDKVFLGYGRMLHDIFTREIKFVEPAPSLIKTFSSMPMYHFDPNMIKESVEVYANNNDSIGHTCTYTFNVQDSEGNYLPGFTGGFTDTLNPFYLQQVSSYGPFGEVLIENGFDPQTSTEDVTFTVNHFINDTEDTLIGDTIRSKQVFSNYFSYDDGTAERSYGASADNVKIAVQFHSYQVDTLRGIQIYFNRIQDEEAYDYFHIEIWNDNNGKPGSLIFEKENLKPVTAYLNDFCTYDTIVFQDSIIRLGVETFYVGVTQTTFDNLNIGFDLNTNSKSKTFYNTGISWVTSPFDGSLMIRPVVGKAPVESTPHQKSKPNKLEIFPNPPGRGDIINLTLPSDAPSPSYWKYLTTRIFDVSGRLLFSEPFEEQISISILDSGFYIIDIFDAAYTKHYTAKLLISK